MKIWRRFPLTLCTVGLAGLLYLQEWLGFSPPHLMMFLNFLPFGVMAFIAEMLLRELEKPFNQNPNQEPQSKTE
jgi:hypothetical protein